MMCHVFGLNSDQIDILVHSSVTDEYFVKETRIWRTQSYSL